MSTAKLIRARLSDHLSSLMVVALPRKDATLKEQPMPAPLEWVEMPLDGRMALVRSGAPACWIRTIEKATALPHKTLCELLGLKLSTVNRKLQNRALLSPDETERLMGLQRLIGQVEAVVRDCGDGEPFDSAQWLAAWLQRPNRVLGGALPGGFLDTAEGREQLGRLIGAQRSGAYM